MTGGMKEIDGTTSAPYVLKAPSSEEPEVTNWTTATTDNNKAAMENDKTKTAPTNRCGNSLCDVNGNSDAIGYSWLAAGRGVIIMSNIYMSQSFLNLAANAAGCFDDEDEAVTGEACTKKIYGFTPSGLISNVFVYAGLAAAFLMPIIGALVDYTDYRRGIGISVSAVMLAIQAVQVYTVQSTWFPMMILQCFTIVLYQLLVMSVYAYLIDIANDLGPAKMTGYSSNMTALQFVCQISFLGLIVILSFLLLESEAVPTAQVSQGLNVGINLIVFAIGWFRYMTPRTAVHKLPEGRNLLTEGFRQNWATARNIHRRYKKGLRWFFGALVFSEAAAQAIGTLSIIYLNVTLKLTTVEVGIFILTSMVAAVIGTRIATWVTRKTNPNTSWKINMFYLFVVIAIGLLTLEFLPKQCAFVWAFAVGMGQGWFFPTENLFFSLCVPRGQEAELSGFFVYCSQVLVWLPPLLFTLCLELGLEQKFALMVVTSFFLVSIGLLCGVDSWESVLAEARAGSQTEEPPTDSAHVVTIAC